MAAIRRLATHALTFVAGMFAMLLVAHYAVTGA